MHKTVCVSLYIYFILYILLHVILYIISYTLYIIYILYIIYYIIKYYIYCIYIYIYNLYIICTYIHTLIFIFIYVSGFLSWYTLVKEKFHRRETQVNLYKSHIFVEKITTVVTTPVYIKYISEFKII